jgi:hypothetical protein
MGIAAVISVFLDRTCCGNGKENNHAPDEDRVLVPQFVGGTRYPSLQHNQPSPLWGCEGRHLCAMADVCNTRL